MTKKKKIYKTLHRKLKIERHDPIKTRGELKCSGRVVVPVPLVALVMLLLLQIR
jgi:hypothetical protein